jgi:hypothetical protein
MSSDVPAVALDWHPTQATTFATAKMAECFRVKLSFKARANVTE